MNKNLLILIKEMIGKVKSELSLSEESENGYEDQTLKTIVKHLEDRKELPFEYAVRFLSDNGEEFTKFLKTSNFKNSDYIHRFFQEINDWRTRKVLESIGANFFEISNQLDDLDLLVALTRESVADFHFDSRHNDNKSKHNNIKKRIENSIDEWNQAGDNSYKKFVEYGINLNPLDILNELYQAFNTSDLKKVEKLREITKMSIEQSKSLEVANIQKILPSVNLKKIFDLNQWDI
jgi:hypothetical protein